MLSNLKVKVGPQFYQYSIGALDVIPTLLEEHKVRKILIVHGSVSWEKAIKKLNFLNNSDYQFIYHQYTGECSYYGSNLIVEIVKNLNIDFIIGVGGGKLTDLVGYASHIANVDFGVIPTLASNCAPWTPLAVMYKETGEAEGNTEHFLKQAAFLVTDPELIIDSPVEYFIAGIADTLAKWYESDAVLQQDEMKKEPFLQLATYASVLCKEAIMQDSKKAIQAMQEQRLTEEFIHVSEIIFAVAGLVGGFGDNYAGSTAAHAMHDAMSKYIPKSHEYLHGEKVAYGIFYQLALEKKWAEIDKLISFYQELNLPMSLKQMNIYLEDDQIMDQIVQFINAKEKVHLIPIELSEEIIRETIMSLEKYIQNKDLEGI